MIENVLVPIVVALVTGGGGSFVTWKRTTKNYKLEKKKLNESERANTTTEWKELYEVTVEERDELKREFEETRGIMDEMRDKINKIKFDMYTMQKNFVVKEKGYMIRIDQLEEENDELKEENTILKDENAQLKEEKHEN